MMVSIPTAALAYRAECETIGKQFYLSEKVIERFKRLEEKLNKLGIDPKLYVGSCVRLWQDWAEDKKMNIVPINVVCGDKAINRFIAVDPFDEEDENYDLLFYYIHGASLYTFRALVEGDSLHEIRKHLSESWYPENWEDLVNDNAELVREIERDAAIELAESHRVTVQFYDVVEVAESYRSTMESIDV